MEDKATTYTVRLERRSLPGQLRYLAGKLSDGTDPSIVAVALQAIADEQDRMEGYLVAGRAYIVMAETPAEREGSDSDV